MKTWMAFLKKEWMEWVRTGRFAILGILFVVFGIMNPAIAKLTPWLFEVMAESLEETGLIVSSVHVDALTSWTQFFKNIPMGLIAFVLICSGIVTKEYQSGTLVLVLTKGLKRSKVLTAKVTLLMIAWSTCYWGNYLITYGYNAYFWDNSIVKHLLFSAVCWWMFGIWVITLLVLFSAILDTNTAVLGATGSVVIVTYLVGLFPKLAKYFPTTLMDGMVIVSGMEEPSAYRIVVWIACIWSILNVILSLRILNKKQM